MTPVIPEIPMWITFGAFDFALAGIIIAVLMARREYAKR
jgi:hypothetical protein